MIAHIASLTERSVSIVIRLAARIARSFEKYQMFPKTMSIAAALGLGMWGWEIQEPANDFSSMLSNLFRTAQLVTLHFPERLIDAAIPWQLQVSRLLVPFVAFVATIHVVVSAFTRPARLALMSLTERHVIVCGSVHFTVSALEILADRGQRIVTVDESVAASRQTALEALGLTVVEADPSQSTTFVRLNLPNASAVFFAHDDDLKNVELALAAIESAQNRSKRLTPLLVAVRIDNDELAFECDLVLDRLSSKYRARYRRLQPDRESLRIELQQVAPVFLKQNRSMPSRILIVGLAGRWQEIVMQAIIASQDVPDACPIVSLAVDEAEEAVFRRWQDATPELHLIARFEIIRLERRPFPSELLVGNAKFVPPDLTVILRNDGEAVATALFLRRPTNVFGITNQPILVRRSEEDRVLERLNGVGVSQCCLSRLHAFGGLVRAETVERVLDHRGEEIAMALHEQYRMLESSELASTHSVATWDDLSEDRRQANRAAADHASILFAAVGRHLAQRNDALARSSSLISNDELEALARIEHRRWMAHRVDSGWRAGVLRDDERRIHDCLVPFDQLSKDSQDKDRSAVRALVAAVQKAGYEIGSNQSSY